MSGPIRKILGRLPWFLQGPNGGAFMEAFAFALELQVQTFREAILASRPTQCEEDALPRIAEQRGLRLYPEEPVASQRERLRKWWQLHKRRGTARGILEHLQPYFLPGLVPRLRIFHTSALGVSTCHTLEADGTYSAVRCAHAFNWDGSWDDWSRWWVVIYRPGTSFDTGQTEWDDGALWDAGQVWGGAPSEAQIDDLVSILSDWGSPHAALWGVILADDAASFDPAATLVTYADGSTNLPNGQWGTAIDNDTGKPTRLQTATFLYDRGAP